MKTLTLLRHAKSGWDGPAGGDFERPLNAKGRKAARTIGRELRALGIGFDAILASPAVRVVETVADVAEGYGEAIRPVYDPALYLASPATLLRLVRSADDRVDRLLVIGHNPGLERLAMLLTQEEGNGMRSRLAEKYPTATVAEISFPVGHWRDVAEGSGRVARFIRPRDLDPALGPDREEMA
jgi:phosphohistidine phosphatase